MSSLEDFLLPPEAVRGSKVLDRAAFNMEYQVPAIRLADPRLCSSFLKRLAHACLRFPTVKTVQTELGEDGKVRCTRHLRYLTIYGNVTISMVMGIHGDGTT